MLNKFLLGSFALGWTLILQSEGNTRVDIKLACSGIPNLDPFNGYPDPFAVVEYSYSSQDEYLKIGETKYCDDTNACEWPEVFTFDYVHGGSSTQRLKLDIWDYDLLDANDYVGYVEIFLSDVVNTFENTITRNIVPAGNGNVTIKAVVNATGLETDWDKPMKLFQEANVHTSAGRGASN